MYVVNDISRHSIITKLKMNNLKTKIVHSFSRLMIINISYHCQKHVKLDKSFNVPFTSANRLWFRDVE